MYLELSISPSHSDSYRCTRDNYEGIWKLAEQLRDALQHLPKLLFVFALRSTHI